MSRQKVLDVGAFYVAIWNGHIKGFVVATKLARQSWRDRALGAERQKGLGRDRVDQGKEKFCRDRVG